MVKIELITKNGDWEFSNLLFVCPTVDRAKEIVNEGGHVAGRNGPVDNDTGWKGYGDEWIATILREPDSRYMISPVEYKE